MDVICHSTQDNEESNRVKNILNLTTRDFTDRQIREVYNHDYKLCYPVTNIEYNWHEESKWGEILSFYVRTVQDKINKMVGYPDCVIVDIPEAVIPQFNRMFKESGIKFLYVRTTLTGVTNDSPIEVKSLVKTEE